jgi:hypothetical protein
VALHFAGDEQTVGRTVDISAFDVHPRAVHEAMQMFDGGRFFAGQHCDAAEHDCISPPINFNSDGVAVDHIDDSCHRYCCHESGGHKKAHDIYESFHCTFRGAGEFGSGRAEDRGLVWAAKSTTARRLCEN